MNLPSGTKFSFSHQYSPRIGESGFFRSWFFFLASPTYSPPSQHLTSRSLRFFFCESLLCLWCRSIRANRNQARPLARRLAPPIFCHPFGSWAPFCGGGSHLGLRFFPFFMLLPGSIYGFSIKPHGILLLWLRWSAALILCLSTPGCRSSWRPTGLSVPRHAQPRELLLCFFL